jgi:hypothetical protein
MWRTVYQVTPQWRLPEYKFGEQRKLCERCAHLDARKVNPHSSAAETSMICKAAQNVWRGDEMSCIGARTEGPCGDEGKLFKEKE